MYAITQKCSARWSTPSKQGRLPTTHAYLLARKLDLRVHSIYYTQLPSWGGDREVADSSVSPITTNSQSAERRGPWRTCLVRTACAKRRPSSERGNRPSNPLTTAVGRRRRRGRGALCPIESVPGAG